MWVPHAAIETIILEASDETIIAVVKDFLKEGKNPARLYPLHTETEVVAVPKDATRSGVPVEEYDAYRRGLISACADAVCVRDMNGKLEVPLIARARAPFQGRWWVQGGAIYNFHLISRFAFWKTLRESNQSDEDLANALQRWSPLGYSVRRDGGAYVIPSPLGVYRTAAEDSLPGKVCDTLNVAYLVLWPAELPFGHDKDHTAIRWMTLPELKAHPNLCGHWYPQRLATRALEIVAAAKS